MNRSTHNRHNFLLFRAFYRPETKIFTAVNDFLSIVTLVSIIGIILESVYSLQPFHSLFITIEYVTATIFTFEYIARLIAAPKKKDYIFSFFGIIDLLSIIPTFLHVANLTPLKSVRSLRILRLLRILRIAKIARLHNRLQVGELNNIYYLNLKIYIVSFLAIVTILGSIVYVFEHDHTAGFENIPESMLWILRNILEDPFIKTAPQSAGGVAISLIARFMGLILLGFLIHVIGNIINHFLLGTKKVTGKKDIKETL